MMYQQFNSVVRREEKMKIIRVLKKLYDVFLGRGNVQSLRINLQNQYKLTAVFVLHV